VIAAAGFNRPAVFSWESSAVARDCSVRYPDLIGRLVLCNPRVSYTDEDADLRTALAKGLASIREGKTPGDHDYANPGRGKDPVYRAWNDAAGRAGASPRIAERLEAKRLSDPPFDNGQVRVPTLVITRTPGNSAEADEFIRRAVHQIPHAEHAELGRGDFFPVGAGVDDILAVISRHLTGEVRIPTPERQLTVIMFTDLVGSTRRAISSGDAAWKQLLDRHDAVNHFEVTRRGGEVIKTTGDGVLALLPSATAAVNAARAVRSELEHHELQVRVGIHIGEIDRRGDDVSGVAVNTAARVMSIADAGTILVSAVVTQMTDVAPFTSTGPTALKDLDGTWELYTVP
jgi:class 3 adenylate cyclase